MYALQHIEPHCGYQRHNILTLDKAEPAGVLPAERGMLANPT
jgi:hypothetical protein